MYRFRFSGWPTLPSLGRVGILSSLPEKSTLRPLENHEGSGTRNFNPDLKARPPAKIAFANEPVASVASMRKTPKWKSWVLLSRWEET